MLATEFAQAQCAVYEQFLNSNHSKVLAMKAAGEKPTPGVISKYGRKFNSEAAQLSIWLNDNLDNYYELYRNLFEENFTTFLDIGLPALNAARQGLENCLSANGGTFLSALKFGSAFNGFSDLLADMHGSMGYLVQRKSQEMKWNVRTKDGKSMSSVRYVYTLFRHAAYVTEILAQILTAKRFGQNVRVMDKNGDPIAELKPEELTQRETFDKFFHVNSENYVAF